MITLTLAFEAPWPAPVPPDAPDRLRAVAALALRLAGLADGPWEISLVLTDDARMQRLNRAHRGRDAPTDVLSFPQSSRPLVALPPALAWQDQPAIAADPPWPPGVPRPLGDLVLALPTVARQAAAAGHSLWRETCFLVAHGALHLVGYDDQTAAGYAAMLALQAQVLGDLAIV